MLGGVQLEGSFPHYGRRLLGQPFPIEISTLATFPFDVYICMYTYSRSMNYTLVKEPHIFKCGHLLYLLSSV
jgi:hypothetical protein